MFGFSAGYICVSESPGCAPDPRLLSDLSDVASVMACDVSASCFRMALPIAWSSSPIQYYLHALRYLFRLHRIPPCITGTFRGAREHKDQWGHGGPMLVVMRGLRRFDQGGTPALSRKSALLSRAAPLGPSRAVVL